MHGAVAGNQRLNHCFHFNQVLSNFGPITIEEIKHQCISFQTDIIRLYVVLSFYRSILTVLNIELFIYRKNIITI